jgi:ribosomal protein S17E
MGTAMLKPLKTKAEYMMELLGDKLNDNFENNKKVIRSLNLPFSKITTNKIAGYIASQKKKAKRKNI